MINKYASAVNPENIPAGKIDIKFPSMRLSSCQ